MRRFVCIVGGLTVLDVGWPALSAGAASNSQHLQFLDRFAGDWHTKYELDGQKTEGDLHARWVPGKYRLTWTARIRSKEDGKLLSHGSGIIGWDPAEKRAREMAAMSDGTLTTAWVDEIDGKSVIDRSGTMADGIQFTTRPVGVFSGDRYEFEGGEWKTPEGKVDQWHTARESMG